MNSAVIEDFLGHPVPEGVSVLYSNPPADYPDHDLMRLLDSAEAIHETKMLRDSRLKLDPLVLVLWTDDNSNYCGVYTRGSFAPRVLILDHEEVSMSPVYFSIESFLAAREAGAAEGHAWYELLTDYPVPSDTTYQTLEADRTVGLNCLRLYRGDPENQHPLAFHAMNLLPPQETRLIHELLWCEDMWVQERACKVLGLREYAPAINDLYEVAIRGSHNGRIAAIFALKRMSHDAAKEAFSRLRRELGKEYGPYLR